MINERSVAAVQNGNKAFGFLKPLYDSYCFSNIPNTVSSLLGDAVTGVPADCIIPDTYERVILILIDGFGWRFLEQYVSKYPFLRRFFKEGVVSKLTSQFPSTTAAHLTTLGSNQVVGQHGIYEWFMYEPLLDRVVAPLLYSFAGDKQLASLGPHMDSAAFFPEKLFFQHLKKRNISSVVFQHESISQSIYSKWMFQGAESVGYKTWAHALSLLHDKLNSSDFFYLYYGDFDAKSHRHGMNSKEAVEALHNCFTQLEAFMSLEALKTKPTALIVTADHGMIDIHPTTTYYLNKKMPQFEHQLRKGADGHALAPAGSCRDFFVHVRPDLLLEVEQELREKLKDIASVVQTKDLIKEGFFGSSVSERFKKRVGELAIFPKDTQSIWWHEEGRFGQNFYAMHGGLTPEELEIVFLFLKP